MRASSFVRSWMPAFAWMVVIFIASTDLGSAAHTSRFLLPMFRWFYPAISRETFESAQFLIRKAAHLTEYAVLAILLLRAIRLHVSAAFLREAAAAIAIAGCFAATDEFHQSFTPSRTASPRDVFIDTTGALLGLIVYRLTIWRTSNRRPPLGVPSKKKWA